MSINFWMRTCRKICNFKAFLISEVLSFQCSVWEDGNIGSHKSWKGCRWSFHLLSGRFPISLPALQLSRPRPFLLLGLGEKNLHTLNALLFAKTINLFFLPAVLIPQSSFLVSDYFTLQWLLRLLFTPERRKFLRFVSLPSSSATCYYLVSNDSLGSGPSVVLPPNHHLVFSYEISSTKPGCNVLSV